MHKTVHFDLFYLPQYHTPYFLHRPGEAWLPLRLRLAKKNAIS